MVFVMSRRPPGSTHVPYATLWRSVALAVFAARRPEARRDIAFGLAFWLVSLAPVLKILSFGYASAFNRSEEHTSELQSQ